MNTGFVVQGTGNLFLCRRMRFVHHRLGISRAWVHQISDLSKNWGWVKEARFAFLAQHDPRTGETTLLDEKFIPIQDFKNYYF
jgi:hypothetical protein